MNDDVDFCLVTMFSLAKAEKKEKKKKCCPWWRDAFFPSLLRWMAAVEHLLLLFIIYNTTFRAQLAGQALDRFPSSSYFSMRKNRPSPHFVSCVSLFFFGCWALKKSNIRQHLFIIYENSADSFSFFFLLKDSYYI